MQKNYIKQTQVFPNAEDFSLDMTSFFLDLASRRGFHYFGDFHSCLHHTSLSEAPAERKIKRAKNMTDKHMGETKATTVVLFMKPSSRKNLSRKSS